MVRRMAVVGLALATSACATVLGSKQKQFSFGSTPDGAEVTVDGNPVGMTPLTVELSNTQAHTVVFHKKGFTDIGCEMGKGTGAGWVIADVVFGFVPLVVDAATNNWSQTKTHECNQTLQPITASR
jgi:hypothetical protein